MPHDEALAWALRRIWWIIVGVSFAAGFALAWWLRSPA